MSTCAITTRVLLLILLPSLLLSQTSTTARLQGVVNDDSGKALSRAYVVATAQSPTDHSTYSTLTGADGKYSFDKLPPGKYSICLQSPGGPHLNPCQWSKGVSVTLAAAQAANQPLTVTRGALLQIRIDDPHKQITAMDHILLAVTLPSGFPQPMRLAASNPASLTYDTAVPLNIPVRVSVISSRVQLSDSKGNGLGSRPPGKGNPPQVAATSATLTIPALTGDGGPPVVLTVTGRK